MPESVLLDKILGGKEPTRDEMLALIDERAELVRSAMDRVRLTKLCEFGYASSGLGDDRMVTIGGLRDQSTSVGCEGADIYVEGIFCTLNRRRESSDGTVTHWVLGLTHAGWVVAEICEKSTDRMRRIESVRVERTIPATVVEDPYMLRRVLGFLAAEYAGWIDKKRKVLERMLAIQNQMARDDRILDALFAKKK